MLKFNYIWMLLEQHNLQIAAFAVKWQSRFFASTSEPTSMKRLCNCASKPLLLSSLRLSVILHLHVKLFKKQQQTPLIYNSHCIGLVVSHKSASSAYLTLWFPYLLITNSLVT